MGLLADIQKKTKAHHVIFVVGLLIAAVALIRYNNAKGAAVAGMTQHMSAEQQEAMYKDASGMGGEAAPAEASELHGGRLSDPAAVSGERAAGGLPSCASQPVMNPAELLPADNNNEWAKLNPRSSDDFKNVNLLRAGYWTGIDTVGSSLRNANLQVRSEPPNPTSNVSIWNNTTISPDLMRVPLEVGQGCQ